MDFEFSDYHMYNQLLYYFALFDAEKIMKSANRTDLEAVNAVVQMNLELLESMKITEIVSQPMWQTMGFLIKFYGS